MTFKLNTEGGLFEVKTKPTMLEMLCFHKTWCYNFEAPIHSIKGAYIKSRFGIETLYLLLEKRNNKPARIPIPLSRAKKEQINYINQLFNNIGQ